MTEYRTCKAGDTCHWPRGPKQPAYRFTITDSAGKHQLKEYCVSCRAHQARRENSTLRHCAKGDNCQHPAGPWLPEAEFKISNRSRLAANCTVCREDLRQRKQANREKRYLDPGRPRRLTKRQAALLPSIADLAPAYRQSITRWLQSLIIRRDGHPLTRDITPKG